MIECTHCESWDKYGGKCVEDSCVLIKKPKPKEITITSDEADSLKEFIEMNFFDSIRNDPDVDNLIWAKNILSVYEKCGGF